MAVIVRTRVRVEDAAGVPVSGGKFRVCLANTTTLATLYSDAALTVPLTNPVVAGSDGWCAEIFCASANYDCATLTAADVVIKSEDDVPSLGSDAATFAKDFTNSRVQIEGVAGTVWVEAGDASPDNSGGTGRLSGWNRTQADSWTFDAASVNAGTSDGALKENSKKLPGVIYTEVTQVTAQTSVDIQLPNSPTGVTEYELTLWDYSQSGNGNLISRFSYDGGGTYAAGVADYAWLRMDPAGTGNSLSTDNIQLVANLNGLANKPARLRIFIITPGSGNNCTAMDWNGSGVTNTVHYVIQGMGYGPASSGRATHIRFLLSAAVNFTFKYRLTPRRGSGDA